MRSSNDEIAAVRLHMSSRTNELQALRYERIFANVPLILRNCVADHMSTDYYHLAKFSTAVFADAIAADSTDTLKTTATT